MRKDLPSQRSKDSRQVASHYAESQMPSSRRGTKSTRGKQQPSGARPKNIRKQYETQDDEQQEEDDSGLEELERDPEEDLQSSD